MVPTSQQRKGCALRRRITAVSGALLLLAVSSLLPHASAEAQSGGTLVRIIVPFAAGGSADLAARLVGTRLSEQLHRSVIVENKSGAGAQLGLQEVVRAAPDGRTLLVTPSGPISITPHLQKLPYDPSRDLTPVAMIAFVPSAIAVNSDSTFKTLRDVIETGQHQSVSFSVPAIGTHMHLAGELLHRMTGAQLEAIPYRGTAPAAAAVAGGEVPVGISDLASLMPMARAGKIRILAVTGARRTTTAPDLPTVSELGVKGYAADAWIGMFAPAGMAASLVEELNRQVATILQQPGVRQALINAGLEAAAMNPAELKRFLSEDTAKWQGVIRSAQIVLTNG